MIITKFCPVNGKDYTYDIPVTEQQYAAWKNGNKLVQEAFPHLNEYYREFLISGMSFEAQDAFFKDPMDLNERDE